MNIPLSDDGLPVELLAAFVDGELSHADRARVEQWLGDHPGAAAELADQESLSPANGTFWQEVAIPLPSSEKWNTALSNIRHMVLPDRPTRRLRRWPAWVSGIVAAGIAASVLVMLISRNDEPKPLTPTTAAPVAAVTDPTPEEKEVFVVAQTHDVEIFRVPGDGHAALVVGEHPLEDAPLVLAKNADLEVLSFGGVLPNEATPDEPGATMIWPPQKK